MIHRPSRRDIVKATLPLAVAGAWSGAAFTRDAAPTFSTIDALLRAATNAREVAGVVALAATDQGLVYEGVCGKRRLPDGAAMTRDTVFRIASMVKLITSVAALQLVEQNKLAFDTPVPDIDPALGTPQVLDGFDASGRPQLRAAERPITLHHLLTHTSGFVYRLWDAKALRYAEAIEKMPAVRRSQMPRTPLMFDPGERWQYGTSIDWVGRIVEAVSGEALDEYFRRHILDPLGMKDTGFMISAAQRAREASVHRRAPDGSLTAQAMEPTPVRHAFSGGGGIYASAPDYLTLLRALLRGGALDGVRVLRPDTVALMGRNQIGALSVGPLKTTAPAVSNDVDLFAGIPCKWGFGHMITTQQVAGGRSAGSLTWAGLFNTFYWIDPKRRVAAVFMTQVLPFADNSARRLYGEFERALYAALNAG